MFVQELSSSRKRDLPSLGGVKLERRNKSRHTQALLSQREGHQSRQLVQHMDRESWP
jgi:hypothetical protein